MMISLGREFHPLGFESSIAVSHSVHDISFMPLPRYL